jgi:hypothetical protein
MTDDRPAFVVGLLADPGLPQKVADALHHSLAEDLRDVDGRRHWSVEVSARTLPLDADGNVPLLAHAEALRSELRWDYLIYLTDLPRAHQDEPMVCELSSRTGAALVSLPALGALNVVARTRRLLVTLVESLRAGSGEFPTAPAARQTMHDRWIARRRPGDDDVSYLVRTSPLRRLVLLAGMVRNNRPGRLLTAMSSSLAASVATGAFGIFYATIWNMADSMTWVRLASISAVVIVAFSAWLILHNGLWSRRGTVTSPGAAGFDNAATVLTVGLSAVFNYVALYLVLVAGALTVITPDYLEGQLGHPVRLRDYMQLSWLAASLGMMGGALGSNFDSDESIREATYSRREHQRRRLMEQYEDDGERGERHG